MSEIHKRFQMGNGLLKSGAKPARGGKRKGAGRKPDWLKAKCANLIDRHKLIHFIVAVANGTETEPHVTKDGEVIECAASIHDRLRAVDMLLDRGYGKPMQSTTIDGSLTVKTEQLAEDLRDARLRIVGA